MADTTVDANVYPDFADHPFLWGPYWSDESTAIVVYVDDGFDLSFARTVDKGTNWAKTEIEAGTVAHIACWYDKETPGDAGTLIHIAWLDSVANDAYYMTLDVADASQGTKRTVDSTITVTAVEAQSRIAVTKTVSGNLIVAFSTQTEIECYKSSDNFATAGTDIADVYETGTEEDWVLLFPAATADDDDACAMFWDRSSTEITLKMYDDSANTWTEFATKIAAAATYSITSRNMDGAVRHSDSHVLAAWHSDFDTAGDDFQTADLTVDDIAAPTVTAKTNIYTNQAESSAVSVLVNQQNDDVYVAYGKGGTWNASVDVVYHKSADGMGSWAGEQAYSEGGPDDYRLMPAGRTVGNAGGRYQPCFYNDDLDDLYVNEVNDIEIAAAVAGVPYSQAVTI